MENIEQLKQDNAKLTERLNNAAKFFREQKVQIEALTKENEELKRTPKEEVIDTEKWNQLVAEKEKLQKQIEGYENERKSNEAYSDDLNKQLNNYELKLQKLESDIDSKDKAYKVLQDTYNEVFADYNKLKEQITQIDEYGKSIDHLQNTLKSYEHKIDELENNNPEVQKLEEQLVKAEKTIENDKLDYNKLNKEHKALNDTYNKLNNEYSDIYTKYNDLEQGRIKSEEQLNALNTLCSQFKEDNKALQDKYDNLEKICNDFENQKLAADADYQGILDMYQELQKEYERLRNERDIYSQSDDALAEITKILIEKGLVNKNDLTPQTAIKESGTAHRMGDSLEGGKNVGV